MARTRSRPWWVVVVAAAAFALAGLPGRALADDDATVLSAAVNTAQNTLVLSGRNLRGVHGVSLGATRLTLVSSTSSSIVAAFPPGSPAAALAPGTYLVVVRGHDRHPATFIVAVGASGPPGPPGPPGPAGPPGGAGGTLSSLQAVASSGTPADASQPSANPGQTITLQGTGLSTSTLVVVSYTDVNGLPQSMLAVLASASGDGRTAVFQVPPSANGVASLRLLTDATVVRLQIVPFVSAVDVQERTVLIGGGFVEGGTTYGFPGRSVADAVADGNQAIDVSVDRTGQWQNVTAALDRTALPTHGIGPVTVTTTGGTSAPFSLRSIRVSVPGTSLGDLAVDAAGRVWVSDQGNPGHLQAIDPGTGQVVQTLTLGAGVYGTAFLANLAGLQLLRSAVVLAGVPVPAGSLLVFNGNPATDRVVAIDPSTGAVFGSLNLPQSYGLTAGVLDPATGLLLVTSSRLFSGSAVVALSTATGAQGSVSPVASSVQGSAGLAINPLDGHLWLGSAAAVGTLSEYTIGLAGLLTLVRTVDISSQGIDQSEVSGLSFDTSGVLWVASTQGEIYRIVP